MKTESKTKTEQILRVMYVLSWIVFIGLMIKTGAILVSYGVSLLNPGASHKLYSGLSFQDLREFSFWHYTQAISFLIAFSAMKAYVFYLVIQVLSKVNLVSPFTTEVTQLLEKISYILLGVWIVTILGNSHLEWLAKREGIYLEQWSTEGFLFMAGLVFIISQIFKRGVEIQTDNELTV